MGQALSEVGNGIGIMVFTPTRLVNLFHLSDLSPRSLSFPDPQVRDNFVYAISYFYNFVTSHLP